MLPDEDIISLIIPDNIHLRFRSRSMMTWLSRTVMVVEHWIRVQSVLKMAVSSMLSFKPTDLTLGAKFLDDFTRLSIAACTSLGFTTGIDDEDLSAEALQSIKNANIEAGVLVQAALDKFGKDGRGYETRPGRTPRETLEERYHGHS